MLNTYIMFSNIVILTVLSLLILKISEKPKDKKQDKPEFVFFGSVAIGVIFAAVTGNASLLISALSFFIYIFTSFIWWITHFWLAIALLEIVIMGIAISKQTFFDVIIFFITAHISFFKGMFFVLTLLINTFIQVMQTILHVSITGTLIG